MRPPLRPVLVVVAALAVAARAHADADPGRTWQGTGRVETGGEYDSNPARAETVGGVPSAKVAPASPAARIVVGGDVSGRAGERVGFAASASLAGRAFTREGARDESVGIIQGSGLLSFRLADALALMLSTAYYDGFQKRVPTSRDFRSIAPSLRLDASFGRARVFGGGGYRWFTYKPEPAYNFQAPTAMLGLRLALVSDADTEVDRPDWDLVVHASWEGRQFAGQRCASATECPPPEPLGRRRDDFFAATAEVTRTAGFLAGLGVSGHLNASNTYGETLQRLIVFLRGSFLLPLDLSLSTRVDVVLTRYDDRLPLARSPAGGQLLVSLEEESRSTLRVELARSIGTSFEAAARWTFYTSAPSSGAVRYERHVFLASIAWLFGDR